MIVKVADDLWINSDHVMWAQINKADTQEAQDKPIIMMTTDGQVWGLTWEEWGKVWK